MTSVENFFKPQLKGGHYMYECQYVNQGCLLKG